MPTDISMFEPVTLEELKEIFEPRLTHEPQTNTSIQQLENSRITSADTIKGLSKITPMMERAKGSLAFSFAEILETIKNNGMPENGTYSATHICATSMDDLILKIYLINASILKAVNNGKITVHQSHNYILPVMDKMVGIGEIKHYPALIRIIPENTFS